jgi:hypothetical protein
MGDRQRIEQARTFVRRCLVAMGQTSTEDVIEETARKVADGLKFLDGRTGPKYDCGYDGCELVSCVPHGHN